MLRIRRCAGVWTFFLGLPLLIGVSARAEAGLLQATESVQFGSGYPSVSVNLTADSGSVGQFFHREASVSFPAPSLQTINSYGDVNASASYLRLRASAIGQYIGPLASGNVPAVDAKSTASFTDALTITSPGMTGTGLVAYAFKLSGFVGTTLDGNFFGTPVVPVQLFRPIAEMGLSITQGPTTSEIGDATGFEVGPDQPFDISMSNQPFVTNLLPFTFGEAFDLKVALNTELSFDVFKSFSLDLLLQTGDFGIENEDAFAFSKFYDTVELTGVQIFDANGNPISDFAIASDSGTAYPLDAGAPVPEPSTFVLSTILFGLFAVVRLYNGWKRSTAAE